MYKIEKKLEKLDRQIEMLLKQKKEIEEVKKEKEKVKVTNLSETKKKNLLRIGKVLDEAGIKTVKQARELLASTIKIEDKLNERTIEVSKSDTKNDGLENIDEVIEKQKKVTVQREIKINEIEDTKVFKAKDDKKIKSEEKIIPKQPRKDKFKEDKKKINNTKSKEKTRNRLFG